MKPLQGNAQPFNPLDVGFTHVWWASGPEFQLLDKTIAASDNFDRADSTNLGSNWTEIVGTGLRINGNILTGNGSPAIALWSTPMGSNDHYAQAILVDDVSYNMYLYVRFDSVPGGGDISGNTFYRVAYEPDEGGRWRLSREGTQVAVAIGQPYPAGKMVRMEAQGSVIRVLVDGVQVISYTEGTPRIGGYVGIRADQSGDGWNNFQAGPLTTTQILTWPDEIGTLDAVKVGNNGAHSYVASSSVLNNKPVIRFTGDIAAFLVTGSVTTENPPFSVVVIGCKTNVNSAFWTDGMSGSPRVASGSAGDGPQHEAYNGSGISGGTSVVLTPELWVGYYHSSSGQVEVNGSIVASGSTGTQGWNGFTFGSRYAYSGAGRNLVGDIAFIGYFPGSDVRASAKWSQFETWVTATYGITIA